VEPFLRIQMQRGAVEYLKGARRRSESLLRGFAQDRGRFFADQQTWPRSESDQESAGGPPGMDEHLVSLLTPTSFEAERYRTLRLLIEQKRKETGLRVLAVTSPAAGDGKTTTAINLAGALAQSAENLVLLVCADLRRPSLNEQFGMDIPGRFGLVSAIMDPGQALDKAIWYLKRFNLSVMPAGPNPADPYEVLKSPRLGQLLEEARQRYDYIVLDTPPLVLVPDCRIIGKWVDGFLVVVAAHKTPRKLVEEALNLMDPEKLVGLVFNFDDQSLKHYPYDYYAPRRHADQLKKGWWSRLLTTLGWQSG
jgi:capsular exopolysaccharide synthesis family protein